LEKRHCGGGDRLETREPGVYIGALPFILGMNRENSILSQRIEKGYYSHERTLFYIIPRINGRALFWE
jgi:archaellum biogenesis ATPase FlaH